MADSHILIAGQRLSASAPTVTFSNIPSTYRDLILIVAGLNDAAATATDAYFRVNGDSSAIYNRVSLVGSSTTPSSGTSTNGNEIYDEGWSTVSPLQLTAHFIDYAQTNKHKSIIMRGGNGYSGSVTYAALGRYASTNAITSITCYCTDQKGTGTADNWAAGSTFYLWGVTG
jgi:hypothetical protein